MACLVLEIVLFVLGLTAFVIGLIPLSRRRRVRGSAARVVGVILMIPLPLYLVACRRSDVSPLGPDEFALDPLKPMTEGFVRLVGVAAAFMCVLAATVLALVASDPPRRP